MNAHCLAKFNGGQLELQADVVNYLTNHVSKVDYIAVLCALGPPSSAKTGIMNAIVKHFLQNFGPVESRNWDGFLQPKNAQNDGQMMDGILVATPPFIIQDNLGRQVAVILVDLWNNGTMSEEVYGKLVDFCFQVSSVQVFTLFGPLRQVTWWNGCFDASCCSPGLKQIYSHLLRAIQQWLPQYPDPVVAVKTCWTDATEFFRIMIHEDGSGAAVNLHENCFQFILTQIFSVSQHDGYLKPASFKDHLISCVAAVNNSTPRLSQTGPPQPQQNLQTAQTSTENPARSRQILEAYKTRLLEVYSKSPQLFLCFQELKECSNRLVNELGTDPDEVVASCAPYYQQLQQFHTAVRSSLQIMEAEVGKNLRETLSVYEQQFASGFKNHLENYKIHPDVENVQRNLTWAVDKIADQALATLHLSQCPLKAEIEILTSKLRKLVKQQLLQELEKLEKQVEFSVSIFKAFKSKLDGKLLTSTCVSEKEFNEIARHARNSMKLQDEGNISPLLVRVREEAMQEYEDKLCQQNRQLWKTEMSLATQATQVAADFVLQLLTEYLKNFGVLTDNEVMRAFRLASKHAKNVFLTVAGFDYAPPWHEAFQSLQSVFEDRCCAQVRQTNLNAVRRWDRLLGSALQSSAVFYSQQMDQRLPKHNISLKELESTHQDCADKTESQFTVSSEVNDPTRMYWKKLLVKNQLQEWKEGYVRVNESKPAVEQVKKTHFPQETQKTNTREVLPKQTVKTTPAPETQSVNLPPSNVGIYFGPDIVIFTASLMDGTAIQLPMLPFAACSDVKMFWGHEALKVSRTTGQLINIFSILTEPTVPLEKPCTIKLSGESVCLSGEALSVLFFKEMIAQIINVTGRGIQSCAVTLPGLLPRGAVTAVKEAVRLAGFSKVTLVPFTTALAMPVALAAQKECGECSRSSKKVLTIYHAGELLEAALLISSPGKVQVKKLVGCFAMFAVSPSNLASTTRKLIEQVTEGGLFAVVTMLGTECNPVVKEALDKALRDMDQQKTWSWPFVSSKENGSKSSISPAEIAQTMAELDASQLDSGSAKPRRKFPDFNYLHLYEMNRPAEAILMKSSKNEYSYAKVFRYFPKPGLNSFSFTEGSKKIQWKYTFDLKPHSPSGQFCNFVFLEDGSFRIEPPSQGSDIVIHSSSCKLLTFWGQEIVKQNVERVVKLMGLKDTETSEAAEVKRQEAAEVRKTENGVKFTLSQLVQQVEDGLKNSGLSQGPVYDHIDGSIQECRQLLQNSNTTEQNLNAAMRKLRIRSSKIPKN